MLSVVNNNGNKIIVRTLYSFYNLYLHNMSYVLLYKFKTNKTLKLLYIIYSLVIVI